MMQLNVSITNLNKSQGVVLIIIESLIRSWELFASLQWAFFSLCCLLDKKYLVQYLSKTNLLTVNNNTCVNYIWVILWSNKIANNKLVEFGHNFFQHTNS